MGRTGLEPVTPSVSIRGRRSRQFAGVRSDGVPERNPSGERTVERTRTNVERRTSPLLPGSQPLRLVLTHRTTWVSLAPGSSLDSTQETSNVRGIARCLTRLLEQHRRGWRREQIRTVAKASERYRAAIEELVAAPRPARHRIRARELACRPGHPREPAHARRGLPRHTCPFAIRELHGDPMQGRVERPRNKRRSDSALSRRLRRAEVSRNSTPRQSCV